MAAMEADKTVELQKAHFSVIEILLLGIPMTDPEKVGVERTVVTVVSSVDDPLQFFC